MSKLDGVRHQYPGTRGGKLQHLVIPDLGEFDRVGHDPRIRGEHTLHIGVYLTEVGIEGNGKGYCGGIRAAAAEGGDLPALRIDPLEAGDDHDPPLLQRCLHPLTRDPSDARLAM